MRIVAKIEAPKYMRGIHRFDSLGRFCDFLVLIRSVGESNLGSFIFAIAKDGVLNLSKYGFSISANLDCPDYALASKLAENTGLIDKQGRFRPERAKVRAFVRAFDSARS